MKSTTLFAIVTTLTLIRKDIHTLYSTNNNSNNNDNKYSCHRNITLNSIILNVNIAMLVWILNLSRVGNEFTVIIVIISVMRTTILVVTTVKLVG